MSEHKCVGVVELRAFFGANPYAPEGIVLAAIRMESTPDAMETAIQTLRAAYAEWVPDALGQGSAKERAARAVAHWASAALNEVRGCIECAGAVAQELSPVQAVNDQIVLAYVGFHQVELSARALSLGAELLSQAVRIGPVPDAATTLRNSNASAVQELLDACRWQHPDWQACILMRAARRAGIPVLPLSRTARVWQYGWGSRSRIFFESASNADGMVGYTISRNKVASKEALQALGVPTPAHVLVSDESQLLQAVQQIGWPCVVKPIDQGGGRGVTAGIDTLDALKAAYQLARSHTTAAVMLEAFCEGHDHRLLVIDGELVAVTRREPPQVIGDGVRTVRQLVEALNIGRTRNMLRSRYRSPITLDAEVQAQIQAQGWRLGDVLLEGQLVQLRSNANIATGGSAHDVTHLIHPELRDMALRIAKAFGMHTAGFDWITTDISAAPSVSGGQMIEINNTPGLSAQIAAGFDPDALGLKVLGAGLSRIPTELRVVAEGCLDAEREAFQQKACSAGDAWVVGNALSVGGKLRNTHDQTPWSAVKQVLQDPLAERLVVVCTGADLSLGGMPLDRVDRVVMADDACLSLDWVRVLERAVTPG